uniref:FH2 domain-containing protein n=1 Tax=Ditylenchus dipsaci TaxID=166011 RepID=A0A915E6D6_9BILA
MGPIVPEIPDYLKKRVTRSADVPMKKIPWNSEIIKPTSLNKDSLWAEIDESEVASDDVFEILKAKFSTASKTNTAVAVNNSKSQAKTKKPIVIQDGKVLQSLAILQGSCKLTLKEWHKAILQIDESKLNANLVEQLRQILPPAEILQQLKECADKELQNMVEGEQFVATLASINFLTIRLEAIHLRLCWQDNISELKSSISTIAEACDEIRHSKGLSRFISIVLLAGNYMGRTKASKDTFAFELSALNKLVDTKDGENSETLLHVLINVLDKKYKGRFSTFAIEDFHHVTKATKTDLTEISKTKDSMKNSLRKITTHLEKYTKQSDTDLFLEKMKPFVEHAQKEINVVEGMFDNMQAKWSLLQKYLCFDPKKYPMEKLFSDLTTFRNHYEAAWRDITKTREKKEQVKNNNNQKRQPFKSLQTTSNESNNQATKKAISSDPKSMDDQVNNGLIDKIEQMLEQGRYRPGGNRTPRESRNRAAAPGSGLRPPPTQFPSNENEETPQPDQGYRVRRKGQPTVFVQSSTPMVNESSSHDVSQPLRQAKPSQAANVVPSTEELLKSLKNL